MQMERLISSDVNGCQVWHATNQNGNKTYAVKKFVITEFDPRNMLVNELNGAGPIHASNTTVAHHIS
jgi:hypothetical protein